MKIHHCGKIRVLAAVLMPMILASCSDEIAGPDIPGDDRLGFEFTASIEQDNSSRADESGFADGDRFGAFVVNYSAGQPGGLTISDNQVNNVAIVYNADANRWTPATDIYWRDAQTPADVYGYYPFNNGLGDVETYSFEVRGDQSIAGGDGDMGAYEASDFLWAKAARVTPGTKITLPFTHRLAGVRVTLEKGEGFTGDEWEKLPRIVTVDNTLRTAAIDLSTGVATPTGSFDRNVVMNPEGADTYRAVVIPQSVDAGKTTIGITIDGYNYAYTREGGMSYTAGRLHSFTIRVDKKQQSGGYSLTLVSEDITPWVADSSSHDFEANSYLVIDVPVAGTLKDCLAKARADYSTVKNLKITGQLTDEDFRFMREEMSMLTAVNLKEAKMVNVECRIPIVGKDYWEWPESHVDNMLPNDAFSHKETLRRIILPAGITRVGDHALTNTRLTSTVIIPESVTIIDEWAFSGIGDEAGIVMPSSLEFIGNYAFLSTNANFELKLSNTLKHIGIGAFQDARGATGTFNLPTKLEYLGNTAFGSCGHDLVGDIVIPINIKEIPEQAFRDIGFKNGTNLTLHEGVGKIGVNAFSSIKFLSPLVFPNNMTVIERWAFKNTRMPQGSLKLPSNLKYLGRHAFAGTNISGTLEYPASLDVILGGEGDNSGAFCGTSIDRLVIGDNIMQIESRAFKLNLALRHIEIGKNVNFIGDEAFAVDDPLNQALDLETLVCLAPEPPKMGSNVFRGVYFDKCILEVPEKSVDLYRNAEGWREFQSITPHRELAFNITDIACLEKGVTRTGIVRSEGAWTITECPDWVKVTPDHADYKEELTIKVDQLPAGADNREGRIVFSLNGKNYTTYTSVRQYACSEGKEDAEIVLQQASAGAREIPVFIVGEGFGADKIINGEYMRRMNETMEQLFAIEPYKTYRNYFTVTTALACSPDDGVADIFNSKVNCFDSDGATPNPKKLKQYVRNVSSHAGKDLGNSLIIMVANYPNFQGWHDIDWENCSMSGVGIVDDVYPYDQRGLVQHYAGGAAFAGLAYEYIGHFEHIKGCTCPCCQGYQKYLDMKDRGYFENVTLSSKMADAPWSQFIFHSKYSQMVDMWEGGYNHFRGVWRSEANSVMSTYIAYYNTISRYAIYKQIMRRAGRQASLEDFIANDKIEIPQ